MDCVHANHFRIRMDIFGEASGSLSVSDFTNDAFVEDSANIPVLQLSTSFSKDSEGNQYGNAHITCTQDAWTDETTGKLVLQHWKVTFVTWLKDKTSYES